MKGTELLGYRLKDRISGFTGVATGHCTYISGCNQVLLTPPVSEAGEHREAHWFDEQRLDLLPAAARIELDNGSTPGFDKPPPVR